ncbi:MAG: alpha/beta hydrolase [Candidatus Eremiobacteraeota bacterium]|nr:alpha/beta hydrolase [Candidatus Eremiobacteraeota bacterium]
MLLLIPAVLLAVLCMWIVIPPLNTSSIILAVASIELSPYLLLLNMALLVIAHLTRWRWRRATMFTLGANCVLCTLPMLALVGTDAGRRPTDGHRTVTIAERSIPVTLGSKHTQIRAYLPDMPQRSAAVFEIYGGAWQNGTPLSDAAIDRALAHEGYAVFAVDYRHSPNYRFPAALDDVRSEIAMIRRHAQQYHIDPDRTAVLGHSSGGELAELLAFEPRSAVRALISYSGAVDLAMGYRYPPVPDPIGVRSVIENYIGDTPDRAPQRYLAATPLVHVRRGLPPALLIYGSRDHVVDIRYAWKLRDALRAAGTSVTFLELPWTEHAFEEVSFGLHAPVAYRATVEFLDGTFKGSPSKASRTLLRP